MRRINRRLVLLSIVLVCDVVSVFGRPQEQNSASSTLKDDLVNRYTAFTTATPRSLEFVESYLSTSKNPQYASNVINKKKEDTRFAEPDPSLRPIFQFLLNSTKRKKRNLTTTKPSSDSRLVENFINYSINNLQNPVGSDTLGSIVLIHNTAGHHSSSYKYEPETQYLPVPIYSKIPKPNPVKYDSPFPSSDSISGSISYQTSTQDPYKNWQETPLIFPNSNKQPPVARPPFVASDYYYQQQLYHRPDYQVVPHTAVNHDKSPTFLTPVELQSPTFITPIEYQGPTFVTPISVTVQTPISDGNPPPTIVILEDLETEVELPLSDPVVVEQDPVAAAAGGSGSGAGAAAAAAAAVLGAVGAGAAGIAGIAGGAAVAAAVGTGGGVGGGGGGVAGGTLTPADEAQCRSGGAGASKVCSELITTSSSPATTSGFVSLLDDLIYLFTSINFIGPLMITFWSIIFPPMSIILTSGLGVISFLFPWILPRLWFGRQLTHNFNRFDGRFDHTNNYHQPYYY